MWGTTLLTTRILSTSPVSKKRVTNSWKLISCCKRVKAERERERRGERV